MSQTHHAYNLRTKGKAERLIITLLPQLASALTFQSSAAIKRLLGRFPAIYGLLRFQMALEACNPSQSFTAASY